MSQRFTPKAIGLAVLAIALAGCKATEKPVYNVAPTGVTTTNVSTLIYDGVSDDLLTGGLGIGGLQSDTPPTFFDAANPTIGELRRLAIYTAYRAQIDTTTAGGFSVIYGPNVDANGTAATVSGAIPGTEFITTIDDGTGKQNITMMVQVPLLFNRSSPCVVVSASTDSLGIYGGLPTAGEWAMKRNCAVAYVDKGTGVGVHDLATDTVNVIDGTRKTAATAGTASNFTATMTAAELTAYNAAFPNRMAIKHAHSQQNPEKDWGANILRAAEYALFVLNEQYSQVINGQRLRSFTPENVTIIAAGSGNAGGAVLAAMEQDTQALLDGVVAMQPNVQMAANNNVIVRRGSNSVTGTGKGFYDYTSYANLLQPCAALAAPALSTLDTTRAGARCAALKAQGVLTATVTAAQATEALGLLQAYGWPAEANELHALQYARATPGVAVTYANSYGRFNVRDNLCGYSFAATDTDGKPAAYANLATVFGAATGLVPTAGINLINNNATGGAKLDALSTNGTATDYNAIGAACLRALFTGSDANAQKVATGIGEVRRTGNLRGKPAVIVHGRGDAQVPASFTSRPYYGLNKIVDTSSRLAYYEVTNAQHNDAYIGDAAYPGMATRFVPIQRYFINALDIVFNNIHSGTAIPQSQVVRTVLRAANSDGSTAALAATNVPAIATSPATGDQITFGSNTVTIPD